VPEIICSASASHNFDRGAISSSLYLPPAAVGLNATKLSHTSKKYLIFLYADTSGVPSAATPLTLAVPEIICSASASHNFDRGAISSSLYLPPAAVGLNATKLSHTSKRPYLTYQIIILILSCFVKCFLAVIHNFSFTNKKNNVTIFI